MTPTDISPTATPTATVTGTPTFDAGALYSYSTLTPSGQQTALIYSVTAGEALISSLLLAILTVLLFMSFLLMVRRDR